MKDVVGSTLEEVRMIKAIQRSVGALENGWIGNQTMSDIAARLGADCFPLNVELYGQPCIIARDIEPVNMSGPLPKNAISGSFSWNTPSCSTAGTSPPSTQRSAGSTPTSGSITLCGSCEG
jgi:hypothetical protein